jgi:hypothetical protein
MDLRSRWPQLQALADAAEDLTGLQVWVFGSALRRDDPGDLDVLLVYEDRQSVVALRAMQLWGEFSPPCDIIAMTPRELEGYDFHPGSAPRVSNLKCPHRVAKRRERVGQACIWERSLSPTRGGLRSLVVARILRLLDSVGTALTAQHQLAPVEVGDMMNKGGGYMLLHQWLRQLGDSRSPN